jgi:NAD-dependent dihydropyrimidine dehydrogenase PreA subunit
MAEDTFMGVARSSIPWSPTIDYEKCDFCMDCDDFCPHRVFERRDGDVRLVVANPENCVVFCRACAKTCGPDAISFPDKALTVALIKKLREEERRSGAAAGECDAIADGRREGEG